MNFIEKKNVSFIPEADKIGIDSKSIRSILNRLNLKTNKRRFQEGLEGYFRDSGFDQNTVRESGKR